MQRKYLVAGNWKMNGSLAANAALMEGLNAGIASVAKVEVLVCPPAVYLPSVAALLGGAIKLGAQNLSEQEQPGAYTGELHGQMLREVGCDYVIVGHSERRALYGETNEGVAAKVRTALALGLTPILCVGETLDDRDSGRMEAVLEQQMRAVLQVCGVAAFSSVVVAYEPVWAIGTGRTASPEQAQAAHKFLRGLIAAEDAKIAGSTRLLYGGSVKADNASTLFACDDVDGGLIGGASLKAAEFLAICAAAQALSQ